MVQISLKQLCFCLLALLSVMGCAKENKNATLSEEIDDRFEERYHISIRQLYDARVNEPAIFEDEIVGFLFSYDTYKIDPEKEKIRPDIQAFPLTKNFNQYKLYLVRNFKDKAYYFASQSSFLTAADYIFEYDNSTKEWNEKYRIKDSLLMMDIDIAENGTVYYAASTNRNSFVYKVDANGSKELSQIDLQVYDIKIINENTLYIIGKPWSLNSNVFIKSTDGGLSWSTPVEVDNVIGRLNEMRIAQGGDNIFLLSRVNSSPNLSNLRIKKSVTYSKDGGQSFESKQIHDITYCSDIQFTNETDGFLFSIKEYSPRYPEIEGVGTMNLGDLYSTSDGGLNWIKENTDRLPGIDLFPLSKDRVVLSHNLYTIAKSKNAIGIFDRSEEDKYKSLINTYNYFY